MSEEVKEDNGVMAGHDSSDTSGDEEMKDSVVEQEELVHTPDGQDDDELHTEANLTDNQEASPEDPHEAAGDSDTNADEIEAEQSENDGSDDGDQEDHLEAADPSDEVPEKLEDDYEEEVKNEENVDSGPETPNQNGKKAEALSKDEMLVEEYPVNGEGSNQSFLQITNGDESGSEEEQAAFMRELENFCKENSLEFKPPKFYGEGLNCLKLWRAVTKLGGYDQVTSCKLWRQVGESFKPPKTCTTVSWSFRCFYEKALLEYERHKTRGGELQIPVPAITETLSAEHLSGNQPSGSGRARRDAAARAMQGWHSQRLLGNGEGGDPIVKDKTPVSVQKRDKHLKPVSGTPKRKKPFSLDRDRAAKAARSITKVSRPQ